MYIRFAVTQVDNDTGYAMGIFIAANELRDRADTPPALSARVRRAKEWFCENLPDPEDYGHKVNPRSLFWFKPEATEHIHQIWRLASVLEEGGYLIQEITCHRPGKVLYEDEFQVAAVPWREVRGRL